MAESAVSFLLEQVQQLVVAYSDLISNAEKDFKDLNKDLGDLKAILKNIAKNSSDDDVVKETERQLREVVYEVEDTIDSWLTKAVADQSKKTRRIAKGIGMESLTKVSLAKDVKDLREKKVRQMLEKAEKIRSVRGSAGDSNTEQPIIKKDQPLRNEKVVGFEDQEDILTGFLREVKPGLDIISIIGMPGLGKSTLAWKIFHDQKIGYEFPIRIWVHVSQRFNFRDICLKILQKFSREKDMPNKDDQELSQTVHECLKEEKFLLVMDDVWTTEDWDAFKNVLPYGNGRGKVLITSRILNVGLHAKQFTKPHPLRYLHDHESSELLRLEVFGNPDNCPDALKETGDTIAMKCGGVPLTIVVMGGILKKHLSETNSLALIKSEWEEMSRDVNLGLETNKVKLIEDLVKKSYDGLSYHVREPFLYLGIFPDDYEIDTWTLTRLWIAEGFIQPKEGKSLEETAEEILEDLISRNLLIASKKNPIGEVKVCRVHDMIRAFCRLRAKEQNLFQEIKMPEEGAGEALPSKLENTHRLCLHSHLPEFFGKKVKGPHVRSFLCFRKETLNLDRTFIASIPESFQLLRILHSKSIRFHQFPQKVTTLNHLRYLILCFYDFDLKILPEAISQLWNLQTIVVETTSKAFISKANIWRMMRLRHFKTKSAVVIDPAFHGEAGKNLQALTRVSVPDSSIASDSIVAAIAKRASNLKKLGITGNLATFFQNMSLESFKYLDNLKLENYLQSKSASENPVPRLPELNRFPVSLKRLTLSNTYLDWSRMSTLAEIPKLEVLKLKQNAFFGIKWEGEGHVFKTLLYLRIVDAQFVVWKASTTTFQSLNCLVIKNCEMLSAIPDCVGEHLDRLEVDRVRVSVIESARNIEKVKKEEEKLKAGKWGARFQLSVGAAYEQFQ